MKDLLILNLHARGRLYWLNRAKVPSKHRKLSARHDEADPMSFCKLMGSIPQANLYPVNLTRLKRYLPVEAFSVGTPYLPRLPHG